MPPAAKEADKVKELELFVWSAVFQPKQNNIQKTYKNHQNPLKSYCFLDIFRVYSILARKQQPILTHKMSLSGS